MWRQSEEDGQSKIQSQARGNADPRGREADAIGQRANRVLFGDFARRRRVYAGVEQVPGHRIAPQYIEEDGDRQIRAVEQRRSSARFSGSQ
jgi:hypothetical protein